jgi:hypothetical protein
VYLIQKFHPSKSRNCRLENKRLLRRFGKTNVVEGITSVEILRSDETNTTNVIQKNQNSHVSLTALASQGFKAFRDSST